MDIFKEAYIAGIKLKNRIIRSATHEKIEIPNEKLKNIYLQLAKGEVGAIITGFVGVNELGKAASSMPMFCSSEDYVRWQVLLKEIKPYKTPVILQLGHGGGKCNPALIGRNSLAPSRYEYNKSQISEEMSGVNIEQIILSYLNCIEKAKEVGFDGVQIQASHGYLLSQFLSPRLNRRTDEWGGSTEKRFRILKEIFLEARRRVGAYPILVKLTAYDSDEGGMRIEESIEIAKLLQEASCDAIEVSCGNDNIFEIAKPKKAPVEALLTSQSHYKEIPPEQQKLISQELAAKIRISDPLENYNVSAAEKIKLEVDIPIIVVGGIRNLETIKEIIASGKADYVALSRPFIIEPDIVAKMHSGKQERSHCIGCSHCLVIRNNEPLKCYYGTVPNEEHFR